MVVGGTQCYEVFHEAINIGCSLSYSLSYSFSLRAFLAQYFGVDMRFHLFLFPSSKCPLPATQKLTRGIAKDTPFIDVASRPLTLLANTV